MKRMKNNRSTKRLRKTKKRGGCGCNSVKNPLINL